MHVFVTGASGWIGSATVDELLAAGHEVTGLARSDASAAALQAKGRPRPPRRPRRSREHPGWRRGRRRRHPSREQARLVQPGQLERSRAGRGPDHRRHARRQRPPLPARLGRRRPHPGQACHGGRSVPLLRPGFAARRQREPRARVRRPGRAHGEPALRARPCTDTGDHGFIAAIAAMAREKGVSGYPGDGTNRWAAVHRSDAARLVAPRAREGAGRAHACTPSRRTASPPATSRRPSAAPSACPSRRSPRRTSRPLRLDRRLLRHGHRGDSTATRELLGWTPDRPDADRGPRRGCGTGWGCQDRVRGFEQGAALARRARNVLRARERPP